LSRAALNFVARRSQHRMSVIVDRLMPRSPRRLRVTAACSRLHGKR
jgi:hypothetical protein